MGMVRSGGEIMGEVCRNEPAYDDPKNVWIQWHAMSRTVAACCAGATNCRPLCLGGITTSVPLLTPSTVAPTARWR